MKVKIFSVRADNDFRVLYAGDETRKLSANDYLGREIQTFLDEHPSIELKEVKYSCTPIIPKTASWETTNSEISWEIEKSVIIFFEEEDDDWEDRRDEILASAQKD